MSREEFEKETGYTEDSFEFEEDYWIEYSNWLEKRNEYLHLYINYLLGSISEEYFMDYCKEIAGKQITIDELRNMLTPPDEAKRGRG